MFDIIPDTASSLQSLHESESDETENLLEEALQLMAFPELLEYLAKSYLQCCCTIILNILDLDPCVRGLTLHMISDI